MCRILLPPGTLPAIVQVLECVANVSEGRDRTIVGRLLQAPVAAGAVSLDLHVDADHNRSVLTLAGVPDVMAAAAVALAGTCLELLDLRRHIGVHPRIGVLDVCPFVPLGFHDPDTAREHACHVAREVMQRFGALGLPSFPYDALAEPRVTLPQVRRRAFSGLAPAAGPDGPHPSGGAVAVGVRDVLVAYNVVLGGADLAAARAVASRVRETGGGPAGVRALGLALARQGTVQVSMNLTRPGEAGIGAAWSAVTAAAAERGAWAESGELVGLVPQAALAGCPGEVLQRSGITPDRTLEAALERAGLRPSGAPPISLPVLPV